MCWYECMLYKQKNIYGKYNNAYKNNEYDNNVQTNFFKTFMYYMLLCKTYVFIIKLGKLY